MKIRFLYFEGCPNSPQALELLKEILKERGIEAPVEVIEVKTEEEAHRYNFLGAPTIQINGLDIEKERRGEEPMFGCRIYKTATGSSGIPPREMIEKALEETGEI